MAKLKPFIEDSDDIEDQVKSAAAELLQVTGLKKNKKVEMDEIRQLFTDNDAGIEDVAKMTGTLMRGAEKEETRIRAGELALKVHGIFKEMDEKSAPSITINVVGDSNNVNLQQNLLDLVCPTGV